MGMFSQLFSIFKQFTCNWPTPPWVGAPWRDLVLSLFQSETWRLRTFDGIDWPHENNPELTKRRMAAAGLFYTGTADRVQCAFCLITIEQWEPIDTAMGEHRRHTILADADRFRFCPLMAGFQTANRPINPFTGRDARDGETMDRLNALLHRLSGIHPLPPG